MVFLGEPWKVMWPGDSSVRAANSSVRRLAGYDLCEVRGETRRPQETLA